MTRMIKLRMDPCFEPAHVLLAQLRERRLSAVELLDRYRARCERLNPALNAIIATNFDAARERARQADAASARGESWGPLHGLPMTIKDTIEVAGMPTVCGAPALRNHRPAVSAPAAQRLVDAGAIVFGKTNVPPFAGDVQTFNPVFGTTRNPWNPERTPGGSSGGAAAALAAGLTPLELGSDLAGSIRTPAHFCGVYGHKPSLGLVPSRGHIPGPPGTMAEADLAVIGPMARSADDLALALRVTAGPLAPASTGWRVELPAPRHAKLSDYRVLAWLDDPACPVDPSVRAVLEQALDKLRAAGVKVSTDKPPFSLAELHELYFKLLCGLIGVGLPDKMYKRARAVGRIAAMLGRDLPDTMGGFFHGVAISHRDWLMADEQRVRVRLAFEQLFASHDLLLMPVNRIAAPPHIQKGSPYQRKITVNGRAEPYGTQFSWIGPATLAGLPATAAPVGFTADGLPVGIQIVGAHLHDLSTIDFARLMAPVTGGFRAPAV
ncbi:MAG: amidase [Gammaproteobacteria bacterium]